jgi:hypothetical protein
MRIDKLLVVLLLLFCKISYAQKGTGLVFLDDTEYQSIPLASTAMMGTLPPSRDLSAWFPTPGDQGQQGSCVAWAVGYALKSYQEAVERKQAHNQAFVFSPAYIYNQIKTNGCANGSSIKDALNLLKSEGVTTMAQFPYDVNDCNRMPTSTDKSNARPYAIAEWRTVPLNNEAEVKSHIASGFPVAIGMYIDDAFEALGPGQTYTGHSGQERGGHALVVTGYDDSRGAFKVINSWGTHWGDNGFGWISYSAFKNRVKEAYSAQDIVINDPNNTPNVNPDPTPIPNVPVAIPTANVLANLQTPVINFVATANTPFGVQRAMMINIPWTVVNGLGSTAQIVVRFYEQNGQPLMANPQEHNFRDINGLAAAGTAIFQIQYGPAMGNNPVLIPYYALNFVFTNGAVHHNINMVVTMYVNQFEKARSPLIPIFVNY